VIRRLRLLTDERWWLAALTRDHVRLVMATCVGVLATIAAGSNWLDNAVDDPLINFNVSWVTFSGSYFMLTAIVFARTTPAATRRWATHERRVNPSWVIRRFVGNARGFWFVVTVALFAVIGAVLMIRSDSAGTGEVVLASVSVVLSWLMLQVAFTLHYAFAYHNGGGIVLDDEPDPDLLDFAYLAFTIGTSFTIVDASITTKNLRRVVLDHSVLSFGFNTVLLGLVVTFLAG